MSEINSTNNFIDIIGPDTTKDQFVDAVKKALKPEEMETLGGVDTAAEEIVESMGYFVAFSPDPDATLSKDVFEVTGGQDFNADEKNMVWNVFNRLGIVTKAEDKFQDERFPTRFKLVKGLVEMLQNHGNGFLE
ncbi:MAG: hypothetical protein Q8Q30_00145 [Candidatus Woesebacteria bacterium]|nr:hypothetical protein [Candidatus Woesebacteria bacterium]